MAQAEKEVNSGGGGLWGTTGAIAFFAGFLLALVGGVFWPDMGWVILVLVIMGIIVGLLNITATEAMPFLVAAIALVVAGTTGFRPLDSVIPNLGTMLDNVANYIANLMVPAAIISAVRLVFRLAKPGEAD